MDTNDYGSQSTQDVLPLAATAGIEQEVDKTLDQRLRV
jgi:hypothetical protein